LHVQARIRAAVDEWSHPAPKMKWRPRPNRNRGRRPGLGLAPEKYPRTQPRSHFER
jgi:hypothetical protein